MLNLGFQNFKQIFLRMHFLLFAAFVLRLLLSIGVDIWILLHGFNFYNFVGNWECKQNLVEQKTCIQSFIIYFWDLLCSAMGNSSLSHPPRSKIRTTAETPLKKGQLAAEKTKLLYVLHVVLQIKFSCNCTFAVERYSKISCDFPIFFLLEPNTISDKVVPLMGLYKLPCEYNTQICYRWNIGENYLCNFIQLRRNILLNEINFTT